MFHLDLATLMTLQKLIYLPHLLHQLTRFHRPTERQRNSAFRIKMIKAFPTTGSPSKNALWTTNLSSNNGQPIVKLLSFLFFLKKIKDTITLV